MTDLTAKESFHLEEYRALRDEIAGRIKDQVDVERQVAVSIAAVYAFIVHLDSDSSKNTIATPWLLWLLPFLIVAFGFLRWHLNHRMMVKIGAHIKNIEACIFDVYGWEHWQKDYKARRKWGPVRWINVTFFWYFLLLGTLALALAQIYLALATHDRPVVGAS